MKYFVKYFMLNKVNFMLDAEVKRLRDLLDMTQEQFAKKLGVSTRTIQNWENGQKVPQSKFAMLASFAEKFPKESFSFVDAMDSPGAGVGNDVKGISSKNLQLILAQMESQRKDFMNQLSKKDKQIDELIEILKNKK